MGLWEEKKISIIALNLPGDDGWDGAIVEDEAHEATYETNLSPLILKLLILTGFEILHGVFRAYRKL